MLRGASAVVVGLGMLLASLPTAAPGPASVRFDDEVLAIAYSPDGSLLAAGCADKTIRLTDPSTGKPVAVLSGHADAVAAVAFSRDGSKLASASYDKTVRVWDVAAR